MHFSALLTIILTQFVFSVLLLFSIAQLNIGFIQNIVQIVKIFTTVTPSLPIAFYYVQENTVSSP